MSLSKPYDNIEYSASLWSEYENAKSYWDFDVQNSITKSGNILTILEGAKMYVAGKHIVLDANVDVIFPTSSSEGYFNIYVKIDTPNKLITFEVGALNEFKSPGSLTTIYYANIARVYHTGGALTLENERVVGLTENANRKYSSLEQLFDIGSRNVTIKEAASKLNILDSIEMIIPEESPVIFNELRNSVPEIKNEDYLFKMKRYKNGIVKIEAELLEHHDYKFEGFFYDGSGNLTLRGTSTVKYFSTLDLTVPYNIKSLYEKLMYGMSFVGQSNFSNFLASDLPEEVTGNITIRAQRVESYVIVDITDSNTRRSYRGILYNSTSSIIWKGTSQGQIFNGTSDPASSLGDNDDIFIKY